jgi:hypothetical protein
MRFIKIFDPFPPCNEKPNKPLGFQNVHKKSLTSLALEHYEIYERPQRENLHQIYLPILPKFGILKFCLPVHGTLAVALEYILKKKI